MSTPGEDFRRQMQRQSTWLKESWTWLLENRVLSGRRRSDGPMTALDVGCGPGVVMEIMQERMKVKGVDIDSEMVRQCTAKGLDVSVAPGERLPFKDSSFDLVYCSFLLLWVKDPVQVVSEMRRVSRRWTVCLAEPDFGGRCSHPNEMTALDQMIIDGIRIQGGDPLVGRKLRAIFAENGMKAEIGVHPGVWSIDRLKDESEDEWRWIRRTVHPDIQEGSLQTIKEGWDRALNEGTLLQFNPIFYASAEK
jgi:ubiquinone/menaquinone biosynthesis C-methylase UbiE